eukprot:scaffold26384_cov48-Phaeocystis_antarctica.AAC.2
MVIPPDLIVVPDDERERRCSVQHAQLKRLVPLRIERLLLDRCLGLLAARRLHHHIRVRRPPLVSRQKARGANDAHGYHPAPRRPERAAAAATAAAAAATAAAAHPRHPRHRGLGLRRHP